MGRRIRPIVVPEHLQPHVDALVHAAQSRRADPAGIAFDLVSSWCEVHPDDSGFESGEHGDSFMTVNVENVVRGCDDDTITADLGLVDYEAVTEARRVTWIRQELVRLFEEPGDDLPWVVGEIRLAASDGACASVCYTLDGGGCGETPTAGWLGVYPSLRTCRAECRAGGEITSLAEARAVTGRELRRLLRS